METLVTVLIVVVLEAIFLTGIIRTKKEIKKTIDDMIKLEKLKRR